MCVLQSWLRNANSTQCIAQSVYLTSYLLPSINKPILHCVWNHAAFLTSASVALQYMHQCSSHAFPHVAAHAGPPYILNRSMSTGKPFCASLQATVTCSGAGSNADLRAWYITGLTALLSLFLTQMGQ